MTRYVVSVRGPVSINIGRKVAEAHAQAVKIRHFTQTANALSIIDALRTQLADTQGSVRG